MKDGFLEIDMNDFMKYTKLYHDVNYTVNEFVEVRNIDDNYQLKNMSVLMKKNKVYTEYILKKEDDWFLCYITNELKRLSRVTFYKIDGFDNLILFLKSKINND